MKNIITYINENRNFINSEKRLGGNSIGTPDEIFPYNIDNDDITLTWHGKDAYPFIYDVSQNEIIWGKEKQRHDDIISHMSGAEKKKHGLDLIHGIEDLRWDNFHLYDQDDVIDSILQAQDLAQWKKIHSETYNRFLLGRLWCIEENNEIKIYTAWWNELTSQEFTDYNRYVVTNFTNIHNIEKPKVYYPIDNNGEMQVVNISDKMVKINKRTAENKEKFTTAAQEHYDINFRKIKRYHMQKWISGRNGTLQKKYNKEYKDGEIEHPIAAAHNHKYQMRYNPYTKKMERGEHLGDSMIDTEKNMLN